VPAVLTPCRGKVINLQPINVLHPTDGTSTAQKPNCFGAFAFGLFPPFPGALFDATFPIGNDCFGVSPDPLLDSAAIRPFAAPFRAILSVSIGGLRENLERSPTGETVARLRIAVPVPGITPLRTPFLRATKALNDGPATEAIGSFHASLYTKHYAAHRRQITIPEISGNA
jgi:hypothetical protein